MTPTVNKEPILAMSGEDWLAEIRKHIDEKEILRKEIDRLNMEALISSVKVHERFKEFNSRINELTLSRGETRLNLFKMLDEHEAIFNRTSSFESIEFANDYIKAANFAEWEFARTHHIIKDVKAWIDSPDSLPL